jgi:hypothetical protein
MKITANPAFLSELSSEVKGRISRNDVRNRDGSEEPLITPQFESVDDDDIRSFVRSCISSGSMTDKLVEIEESNLSKLGPRSIAIPWDERRASLVEYYSQGNYTPDLSLDVKHSRGRLRPAQMETVKTKLVRSSNTGLPYLIRKGAAIDEGLVEKSEPGKYPCMLYTRTQEQKKTRNVWGYPFGDTIWEQEFFIPWLGFEKSLPNRAALLGPDHVDRAVSDLLYRKQKDDKIYCVDFSSYDASVQPGLARQAWSYIAASFASAYHEEIAHMYERFISIPIMTPDGEYSGYHGVPSGSSFTNTVDSLVQMLVSNKWTECQVQGDDGIYLVRDHEVEKLADAFVSAGLKLNVDKSDTFSSHEAIFLQRYYHPAYSSRASYGLGGVYSIARALLRLKYLERFTEFDKWNISGEDYFSLRAIMILENCKHHPHFEDLVKFVHKLDRTHLTYSQAGLSAFSKMQEQRVRAGVFNQYGDSNGNEDGYATGLANFETIKLLATL